jgi:D-aminopeptidase
MLQAIGAARGGPVAEGCVGAGTGTVCCGWKGGIGSSSRVLLKEQGGYTVGALVQSNFGGVLQIGALHLSHTGDFSRLNEQNPFDMTIPSKKGATHLPRLDDGSIMIVLATDAPLSDRNLTRLADEDKSGRIPKCRMTWSRRCSWRLSSARRRPSTIH